jgi:hypothetical protein
MGKNEKIVANNGKSLPAAVRENICFTGKI